jgi:hypothetical protein
MKKDSGHAGMTNPALGADVNSLKEYPQDLILHVATLVLNYLKPFILYFTTSSLLKRTSINI